MATNAIAGVELGDPELAAATSAGWTASRSSCTARSPAGTSFVTETVPAPDRRRRQAVPAAVHAAGRADGAPARRRRGDHGRGRGRADPPGHALPRRRHGLRDDAPRREERQLALGQHRRDPHRRLPVRPRVPAGGRPGPDAVRIIAETFAELVTGQMRETAARARATTPSSTTCTVIAEKTGVADRDVRAGTAGMFSGCTPRADRRRCAGSARRSARRSRSADDIIDITSPSDSSGKTPGTDLREGVQTLPMLYALQRDGPGTRPAAACCSPGRSPTTPRSTRPSPSCARAPASPAPARCWPSTPRRPAPSSPASPTARRPRPCRRSTTYVVDRTA